MKNRNSAAVVREQAARIARRGLYAECLPVFMEEAPLAGDWAVLAAKPNVVVAPLFIAAGPHYYRDLPALLGFSGGADAGFPLTIGGKRLWYARPAGSDERMPAVVLGLVKQQREQRVGN